MPYNLTQEAMIKRLSHGFGRKAMTQEEFIKKAIAVHGNKYDYSKTIYKPAIIINGKQLRTRICVICPNHGEFYQFSMNHLCGKGCPFCGDNKKRATNESFIKKAEHIHGKKYDYSKIIYKNRNMSILIVCPIHGEFFQTPAAHLAGNGCSQCSVDRQKLKLEDFINRAFLIHGKKYDYSEVLYKTIKTKICIICPNHGRFYQLPRVHLRGHGCPSCRESKGEKVISQWFIKHNIYFQSQHKFNDLRGLNKVPLEFDFYVPLKNLLVEFDGRQHFEPVQFNGISSQAALNYFNRLQQLDKIKNDYCVDKSISLLRIPYTEFNQVPQILNEKIL